MKTSCSTFYSLGFPAALDLAHKTECTEAVEIYSMEPIPIPRQEKLHLLAASISEATSISLHINSPKRVQLTLDRFHIDLNGKIIDVTRDGLEVPPDEVRKTVLQDASNDLSADALIRALLIRRRYPDVQIEQGFNQFLDHWKEFVEGRNAERHLGLTLRGYELFEQTAKIFA